MTPSSLLLYVVFMDLTEAFMLSCPPTTNDYSAAHRSDIKQG